MVSEWSFVQRTLRSMLGITFMGQCSVSFRITVRLFTSVDGPQAHQEYQTFPSLQMLRILQNKEGLPWSVYVGAAGMPGEWEDV